MSRWLALWTLPLAFVAVLLAWPPPSVSKEARVAGVDLPPGIERSGEHFLATRDGMAMVLVPAGAFPMGSDDGAFDERPAHRVHLQAYLIDRHEVTNAQFQHFVQESGYEPQGPWERGAGLGGAGQPVRFVTWHDAVAYATWAGRRLPTEAQWEKAARGAEGRRYPWGHGWRAAAAHTERGVDAGPDQVGSHPAGASPYGCLDMAGNVWEWVADWYDRRAYEARADGSAVREPTGPEDGAQPEQRFFDTKTAAGKERSTRKVIRGGGWVAGGAENARASKRTAGNPRYWLNDTGFRCALPLAR